MKAFPTILNILEDRLAAMGSSQSVFRVKITRVVTINNESLNKTVMLRSLCKGRQRL